MLFTLNRPRSYVLKGQERWLKAESSRIELSDLVPEDGKIILSLHYQKGLVAAPSRVCVERDTDPRDRVPFVRLRLTGPVARVTLTWDDR